MIFGCAIESLGPPCCTIGGTTIVSWDAEALKDYKLTVEEKAALVSGDLRKIESRVGKLDERLKTWLMLRLSQEKW